MSAGYRGGARQRYLIALGSNVRHPRHGLPPRVLAAALAALEHGGLVVERVGPIIASAPLGPSRRCYANGAAVIATDRDPPALLALLQQTEAAFGRRRRGRRWSARVLDLDIVLWSGGSWQSRSLSIPHPAFRQRRFVLDPAEAIARRWRDPQTGLTLTHLRVRLTRTSRAPR
ncbi:2-amino-4-hydroxy-6-hydroxymethyldihydropteridine diphosphokinase [Novosphingobium lentum]|uniref:2-amino-4-hydroxy-6- hydroxymethyldihydropteridine diphosphokinase n=1 Tax=Novosphingobium lentum TaxID=145287 RepID=UPI000829C3E6|nr:2-amino-4-hydroxy-6-hydroxymethyldihydropteridine diphosphokinase [Novosphingobium lentum]